MKASLALAAALAFSLLAWTFSLAAAAVVWLLLAGLLGALYLAADRWVTA